ncbi:hypothetical protein [Kiloniella majae]|uniref:hypothetical protein n=1 Tax=Kiloniella majae TaxID=1938558 RepID=UPI000A278305|nr:hypothetical protein [Kiloniella majae]
MAIANNPCNSHYVATPIKNRTSLWTIRNLLKKIFKFNKKRNITTLKDMHDLPMHIKKDIGFWDVKPEERPRLPTYH